MCGISAVISKEPIRSEYLFDMNNKIVHRGPDDEGYFLKSFEGLSEHCFGPDTGQELKDGGQLQNISHLNDSEANVLLGHRRLSIRDTSSNGHQPMSSKCRNYVIAYNGEVYNSDELKDALEKKGYQFFSSTDTEVVLYAYIEWGEEMLEKLNGMFAFIVYNELKKEVFLARDRFGVKPLYYWNFEKDKIAFASEIKQFSAFPKWRPKLNAKRAYDYLNWGQTDHTPETMFEGVLQVPPGHFAKIDLSGSRYSVKPSRWYQLGQKKSTLNYTDAVSQFEDIFVDSVKLRLKSDVPVGTCLSGGLDSSSIVCVANSLIKNSQVQKTFSSCSEHKKFDEREFVNEVINNTKNVEPTMFDLKHERFLELYSKIIFHHDEPFLSPSVFAEWCVFETVSKSGVKVTLDGHGADEQLYGYHTFFGPILYSLFINGQWFTLLQELKALKSLHGYELKVSISKILLRLLPRFLKDMIFKLTNRQAKKASWINYDVLGEGWSSDEARVEIKNPKSLSVGQLTSHSLPKQLRWCDRDSMAFSVESRVPFIDYRVVEFLHSMPDNYKFNKGITKRILRDSMSNYLPSKVKDRIDKMGFVTPAEIWVKNDTERYIKIVEGLELKSKGVLNKKAISLFKDMITGKIEFNHTFWRAIFFAEWMSIFDVEVK